MNAEGGWEIDDNNDDEGRKTDAKKDENVLSTSIASLNLLTTTLSAHLETIADAMKARAAKQVEKTPATKKVMRTYCLQKVSQMNEERQ
jgi:hypothetical protein